MKIEIWSDIACPYCYIGKRKLENALSQTIFADKIEIVWHSYELNPALAKGVSDETYYQYMSKIYNSTEEVEKERFQSVLSLAKEVGLNYNPESIKITNTSDALRLSKFANKYQLANEAEEILFKAYFIDGKNISDRDTLLDLGTKIGLNKDAIIQMLDSNEYVEDIKKDMQRAEEEFKLEYIPFYLINNKHIIQGSIAQEDYLEVLQKAYDDWKINGVSSGEDKEDIITGQSCSIDGVCS